MRFLFCILLLFILTACAGEQTRRDVLDLASYGVGLEIYLEVDKANFTIPQVGVPMSVSDLTLYLKLDVGRYDTVGIP